MKHIKLIGLLALSMALASCEKVSLDELLSKEPPTSQPSSTGNVCGYDSNACVFAEFYPDQYGCYVGQYPSRLQKGKTYTIRQAIQYQKDGKWYTATMVVRLKAV